MKDKWIGCLKCNWKDELKNFHTRCPQCGMAAELFYERSKVKLYDSKNPLERYYDLLPIASWEDIKWCGEGNTPVFHAKELGKAVQLNNLWLKNETCNPTKTTKDRVFSVVLSYFSHCGIKEFVMSSTGNSSTSCARGVTLFNSFIAHIFCGRDFYHRLNFRDQKNINVYIIESDFVTAGKMARKFAIDNNLVWEGGFFNIGRRSGLKLAYLEAFEGMKDSPDYVFQAVSSGMGLMGAYQGIQDFIALNKLSKKPKLIAAQQESCCPMVKAWNAGNIIFDDKFAEERPRGLAEAILRGNPKETYPYIREIIEETGGDFVSVTDDEMKEAKDLIYKYEGIQICYASAVALASVIKMRRSKRLCGDECVLVNLTGGERGNYPVPREINVMQAY
jgi:threonine synthase